VPLPKQSDVQTDPFWELGLSPWAKSTKDPCK
jgi:hypothetical protein